MSFSTSLPEKILTLGDLKGDSESKIRTTLLSDYQAKPSEIDPYEILIAYQCEDSYEGSSWFLLRLKGTTQLFENHAGHCSCYGYEDQWAPELTTIEYLKSDKFSFCCYGDDKQTVKDWIAKNL